VKSTTADPDRWLTWIVLPDTESIRPLTQSFPSLFADGVDEEVRAELVGLAEFGLASFEPPHAARDNAVAPVTARMAKRDSRAVETVAGIEVLSIVGRGADPTLATVFTMGAAAGCRLVAD
jgi:predicted secreted protein